MILTNFATQHIAIMIGNVLTMIAVSAENRTAFSAQWVGEDVFHVLAHKNERYALGRRTPHCMKLLHDINVPFFATLL